MPRRKATGPFLDRIDLDSGSSERLFHSQAPYYETPVAVIDGPTPRVLYSRESNDEPSNLYTRALGDATAPFALTRNTHPLPQLRGVSKEQIRYTRNDGVELTADLLLPPGYDPKKDGPRPLLMWAYPAEFKSAGDASQVSGSPHRFNAISYWGPQAFLAKGYVVLNNPTMPIVGEGDAEPNDTYVQQLVASAQAAVDEVVRRGVADRGRIAVGGHSYGAFMTANLLAHTRLFKAGIARSGAYNRTLTPFGFQAEERNYWQVQDTYLKMSPFNYGRRHQGRDPVHPWCGRQQFGHVPDAERAHVRRGQGPGRQRAAGDAAQRIACLPRARIDHDHARRERGLAGPLAGGTGEGRQAVIPPRAGACRRSARPAPRSASQAVGLFFFRLRWRRVFAAPSPAFSPGASAAAGIPPSPRSSTVHGEAPAAAIPMSATTAVGQHADATISPVDALQKNAEFFS